MKLSPAQIQVLADVSDKQGRYTCFASYKPALKLVKLGFVTSKTLKFQTIQLEITETGRAELKSLLGHIPEPEPTTLSVRERLSLGQYDSKTPYPPATDKEARKAWREELSRLHRRVFRDDALKEVGLDQHPKAEAIWDKAWSDGHSSGLLEVLQELEELASLIK